MIFSYSNKKQKLVLIFTYLFTLIFIASSAFAMHNVTSSNLITKQELNIMIKQSNLSEPFKIAATSEVLSEINQINSSKKARTQISEGLKRMQQYKPLITRELKNNSLPNDLLAMPLIQSGYNALDESKNPVQAAGIWQIIPSTGKDLGLNVTQNNDERLDTTLATKAALTLLKNLHNQFHDWKLAVIAYEYGNEKTAQLIKDVGSRDAWKIARSEFAPKELKNYLAKFDSAVIIMHNPLLQRK